MDDTTLILGNCFEAMNEINDHSVDLIIADPPYDLSVNHDGGKLYHNKGFDKSNSDIVKAGIDCSYDIKSFKDEVIRVMKYINVYFWCNKKQIPEYFNYYVNELGCKFEIICWHKTNALPTFNGKYLTDTEYCLYFFEEGHKLCNPTYYEDAKTFYMAPINQKDKKLYNHPTIKPVDLIERFIRVSSRPGDIILDPFMGSGTTGVAARNVTERNFIGIEINPEYFITAKSRIDGVYEKHGNDSNSLFM